MAQEGDKVCKVKVKGKGKGKGKGKVHPKTDQEGP